jgi:hypothetical protein
MKGSTSNSKFYRRMNLPKHLRKKYTEELKSEVEVEDTKKESV